MLCTLSLLLVMVLFSIPALATVTPSAPNPADNDNDVFYQIDEWTIVLTSNNFTYFNGTITCVQTDDITTLTNAENGTATLTFASALDTLTTHQIWVNVTDEADWAWTNTSYNFTTTTTHLRDNQNLEERDLLLVVLLGTVICLVFLVEAKRFLDGSITDYKELVSAIVMVMILIVIMSFI